MEITYSIDEINEVAQKIITSTSSKIIILDADMGMGKTTLIKEIARVLGVNEIANSPTFSIVNEYILPNNEKMYHFDMYRIEDEVEALDFGIEEYLFSGHWCFIEWPERIPNLIPDSHHRIEISLVDEKTRYLKFE